MTPAELVAWRERMSMTQAELAHALGYQKRQIIRWEMGHKPIPKVVELALEQLEKEARK